MRHLVEYNKDIADFVFIDAPFEFSLTSGNKSNSVSVQTSKRKKRKKFMWWRSINASDGRKHYDG